jgi:hypothetical protein
MPVPESTSAEAFERYMGGKCLVACRGEAWRDLKAWIIAPPRNIEMIEMISLPAVSEPFLAWSVFRSRLPRFTPEALMANQALIDLLGQIAKRKNATPAQIALAWLLAQKPWIVPIPGTTKLHRLDENLGAVNVQLTAEDLRDIESAASKITVEGARYPEALELLTGR